MVIDERVVGMVGGNGRRGGVVWEKSKGWGLGGGGWWERKSGDKLRRDREGGREGRGWFGLGWGKGGVIWLD